MGFMGRRPASRVLIGGIKALELETVLLQGMRLSSATGGVWEAADVQWWWRRVRPTDERGQVFWLDEDGAPAAAVICTDFFGSVQCDVLVRQENGELTPEAWAEALRRAGGFGSAAEFLVRSDDATGLAALASAGYRPTGESGVVATWLAAGDRPPVPALAPGYRLISRADDDREPHPMAARNGREVGERLSQCSLYRAELDLAVEAPDGEIAGYGLFWADPVTKVGLVEPMRTESAHQRRGIAAHVLASGLGRLAGHGCQRLKVGNDLSLYLRAGFEPLAAARLLTYARPAEDRVALG
jgi:predicted N-acetyltransferase YhbS